MVCFCNYYANILFILQVIEMWQFFMNYFELKFSRLIRRLFKLETIFYLSPFVFLPNLNAYRYHALRPNVNRQGFYPGRYPILH